MEADFGVYDNNILLYYSHFFPHENQIWSHMQHSSRLSRIKFGLCEWWSLGRACRTHDTTQKEPSRHLCTADCFASLETMYYVYITPFLKEEEGNTATESNIFHTTGVVLHKWKGKAHSHISCLATAGL